MEGWIKLHRKLIENEIVHDDTAYKLFTILLLLVDRRTGKYRAGRFQLSEITGIKPGTLYDALARLEKKYKMATLETNNKYTTISIVNWNQYQDTPTAQPTTNQQQTNTKQEVRIKNNKSCMPLEEQSDRVKYTAAQLGEKFGVTERVTEIIDKDFRDYSIRDSIKKMALWYEAKGKTPNTLGLYNWLSKAKQKGELTLRGRG
jgi:hypothetical protein